MENQPDSITLDATSCFYEPVSQPDGTIPCDVGKTFAQCNIEEGSVLYLYIQDEDLTITIKTCTTDESIKRSVKASTPIANLLETLCYAHWMIDLICADDELALHCNHEYLDAKTKKTFADYYIRSESDLCLYKISYLGISVGVLMYAKLKHEWLKPQETLNAVKNRILGKYPDFEHRTNATDAKRMILRGVVRESHATPIHVFIDLCKNRIEIFPEDVLSADQEAQPLKKYVYIWKIQDHFTGAEIRSFCNHLPTRESRIRKVVSFDYFWTYNILPQIEEKTLVSDCKDAMQLFFFPVNLEEVYSGRVRRSRKIEELLTTVCECVGVEAEQYLFYHAMVRERCLCKDSTWSKYSSIFLKDESKKKPILLLGKKTRPGVIRNKLDIEVQCPSPEGASILIRVCADCTVYALKKQIEDDTMAPIFMQKLFFWGDPLEDDRRILAEVGIVDGSKVKLELIL